MYFSELNVIAYTNQRSNYRCYSSDNTRSDQSEPATFLLTVTAVTIRRKPVSLTLPACLLHVLIDILCSLFLFETEFRGHSLDSFHKGRLSSVYHVNVSVS